MTAEQQAIYDFLDARILSGNIDSVEDEFNIKGQLYWTSLSIEKYSDGKIYNTTLKSLARVIDDEQIDIDTSDIQYKLSWQTEEEYNASVGERYREFEL